MSKPDRSNLKNFSGAALLGAAILTGGMVLYSNIFEAKGIPAEWGKDPKLSKSGFTPKFYVVVYLKFDGAGILNVRHAYFPVDTSNALDDVQCAVEYLRSNGSNPNECRVYSDDQNPKIRYHFDKMEFGSQQRMYVFVDNNTISFNKNTPVSFTPYGAFDSPFDGGPTTRDKNATFFNAEVKKLGNSTLSGLYVENHFKDYKGNSMSSSSRKTRYSININLLACRPNIAKCDFDKPGDVIPLVIDPDTGNGWGSKP